MVTCFLFVHFSCNYYKIYETNYCFNNESFMISNSLAKIPFNKLKYANDELVLDLDNGKTLNINKTIGNDDNLLVHYTEENNSNILLSIKNNNGYPEVISAYDSTRNIPFKLSNINLNEHDPLSSKTFHDYDKIFQAIKSYPYNSLKDVNVLEFDNSLKLSVRQSSIDENVFIATYNEGRGKFLN